MRPTPSAMVRTIGDSTFRRINADADDQVGASVASVRPIGDDRIDLGIRKQRLDAIRIKIARAQKHAADDLVELDYCERGLHRHPPLRRRLRRRGRLDCRPPNCAKFISTQCGSSDLP